MARPAVLSMRTSRVTGALLLLLLLVLMPTRARADCSFDNGWQNASPVNFSPPKSITVPFDLSVGATLYTSSPVSPGNPPTVSCDANTPYGVQNSVGSNPGADYIYPTGVSGIGYRLIHADAPASYMVPYPQGSSGAAFNSATFSVATTLQLVQTGPIVNGTTLPAGLLGYWQWGSINVEAFRLTRSVKFVAPACVVNTATISVLLPSEPTSALASTDSTAGPTPFNIQLNCPSGGTSTLSIQLDATKSAGYTSVIQSTGTATSIGVQLIDQNSNPVVFGTKTVVGPTPAGVLSIPYYARYYRTPGAISVGSVKATATFTLTYQ